MMEKEKYNRLQMEIIGFTLKDVIMASDPIEEDPEESGGGVLPNP